jgi:serine O-acetyltransferase
VTRPAAQSASAAPPLKEHARTGTGADGLSLTALIREDYAAHGRDWTRPGFRALAVYRFGVWRMGWPRLVRCLGSVLYRMMHRRVRNHYGIELDYAAKVGRRLVIEHQHGVVIHGGCVIGDDCVVRQGVTLGNKTMDRPYDAPTLGDRVNVGAGAKVLGAVTLGDGAQVGANAVVVKDVPAGALAVGVPAVVKRPTRGEGGLQGDDQDA